MGDGAPIECPIAPAGAIDGVGDGGSAGPAGLRGGARESSAWVSSWRSCDSR